MVIDDGISKKFAKFSLTGQRTTPSVVAFLENGERVVGIAAKRQVSPR